MTERDPDALELDLAKLRALEHKAPPRRRRSPWMRPVIAALVIAIAGFALIGPTEVPHRLVGLFSDRPVSELSLKGGSWVEIGLSEPDPTGDRTEAMAEAFRDRGADVAFSGAGKLILEIPDLYESDARSWADTITSPGTFEVALVESVSETPPADRSGRWIAGEEGAYLLGEVALDRSSIAGAEVALDPLTGMPEVRVELTGEARARFAELTRDHVGEQLVIIFGGEVLSAPTIMTAIDGGRISILTGASGYEAASAEAEAIARILVGDPLPAEVATVQIESVFPIDDSGAVWAGRGLFAGLLGLLAFAIAAPFRRRLGAPDPEVSPLRGAAVSRRPVVRRIVLTVSAALVAALLASFQLPGLEGIYGDLWTSPAAANVLPFLVGAVVAFGAALAFPGVSALRRRRGLIGFVAGLALLGLWSRLWLRGLGDPDMLGLDGSDLSLAVAVLAGTSLALYGLARLVDRFGVGNGFAAVLAGLHAPWAIGALAGGHRRAGELMVLLLLGGVAIVATTMFLSRATARGRDGSRLRLIGPGIAPLIAVALIGPLVIGGYPPFGWSATAALVALGLAAALLVVLLRTRQGRGARVVSEPGGPGLLAALAVAVASLGYLGGLLLFESRIPVRGLLSAAGIAMATAAVLDVIADVRARWRNPELTRIAAIDDRRAGDAIAGALATAGIDCHLRNQHLRWMTGAAGAWVTLEIWVPAHRGDEAAAIIDGQRRGLLPGA